MYPHDGRVDHLHGCIMGCGQRIHHPVPDASPAPANEAIVTGGMWAKALRQIAPRCPRSQNRKDAIQNTAVVHTWDTARLAQQHRLDGSLFIVGEFIAHDSKLRFEA
jgi:hypothetical protein